MSLSTYHKAAILDTSVLIVLYHLDLLKYLNLFYNKIKIPREVEKEFLTKHKDKKECSRRYKFLSEFYTQNKSWFLACNEYSSSDIDLYLTQKGIDAGEAEAFAQNQALGNMHDILLDERQARKLAKSNNIHHHGVLYILANLDIKYKACNYHRAVETAKSELNTRFSDKIVKQVYSNIKNNKC